MTDDSINTKPRKTYTPPKLTAYGSVAKLTQGHTGSHQDKDNPSINGWPN